MTSNPRPHTQHLATEVTSTLSTSPAGDTTATRRRTGAAWIAGGAIWMSAGMLYAESGWRFRVSSATWLAADLLLAAGIVGLWVLRPHGQSGPAASALVISLLARLLFAAAEVSGLIHGKENEILLPAAALLTALSSIAYGVLARSAPPTLRAAIIAMGLYFFVAMLPFLAATGEPNTFAVAGWGLPAALIGLTINWDTASRPRRTA